MNPPRTANRRPFTPSPQSLQTAYVDPSARRGGAAAPSNLQLANSSTGLHDATLSGWGEAGWSRSSSQDTPGGMGQDGTIGKSVLESSWLHLGGWSYRICDVALYVPGAVTDPVETARAFVGRQVSRDELGRGSPTVLFLRALFPL